MWKMQSDPKPILFDGFEKAFMGVLRRHGQTVPIAIYDYGRCMQIIMDRDGMEEDEAVEWLEVNTLGAYFGETTPAMVFRCSLEELGEECGIDVGHDDRDYGDEHQSDDEDEITEEEQQMVDEAIQNFALNFIKYVREVDSSLYSRAKQYAADFSGNAVVEFIDDGEGDENENGD
jgi:hypothetical protein